MVCTLEREGLVILSFRKRLEKCVCSAARVFNPVFVHGLKAVGMQCMVRALRTKWKGPSRTL